MTFPWAPVTAAPLLTFALTWYAVRPAAAAIAPVRLAAIRSALIVGGFAVVAVEVASALDALTRPVLGVTWLVGLAGAAALAGWRWRRSRSRWGWRSRWGSRWGWPSRSGWRRDGATAPARARTWPLDRLGAAWRESGRPDRVIALTVGALVLAELVVALLTEPNTYDSQTYHLPRIERWLAQGSVELFPTVIHRQVTLPPGAEYLLTHLRLLAGSDAMSNLPQWGAGIGCLVVATRIVAQCGGGRRAQLLTAFVVGTTPMVILQASSTQTDLVTAAWVGCAATLVLDGLGRSARATDVVALGAATGLTAVTKTNGLLGVAPMLLLWGGAQLRLAWPAPRRLARALGASVAVLAVAAVLVGPFTARITREFGHPLGPPQLRDSVPMQRHDPAAVLVNALRVGHTALDTPLAPVRDTTAATIIAIAGASGVDPQDRRITYGRTTFPEPSWYPDEDRVAFPLAGALCLVATALALLTPSRVAPGHGTVLRWYAAAVTVSGLLYAATVKWQPWGNRLLVFVLVLASPLAGLWLAALLDRTRTRRSVAAITAVAVLATAGLSGALTVSYGFPRRLIGTGSVVTTDPWETRFLRRPQWAPEFRWAAERVIADGADRVGVVQQSNNWEYPWWLLLPGREIVALQSVVPNHPPPDPSTVDALVCTGERAVCASLVPAGWRLEFSTYVGYAAPP